MCVSFVVVIISSVLVVKGSMITEDPPLCALLDAATQCENLEIAKICTQLCTPAEDSPLCLLLDAATQCDNAEIAKICPNLCTPDKCPVSEGFLLSPDGTECYIAILNEKRSWTEAHSFCKSEGMMLAEPADSHVAWLAKTLNEKYGGKWADNPSYWVGGRGAGSGSSYLWQEGGGQVDMWAPGNPHYSGTTDLYGKDQCVGMNVHDYATPETPYRDLSCTYSDYHICQI